MQYSVGLLGPVRRTKRPAKNQKGHNPKQAPARRQTRYNIRLLNEMKMEGECLNFRIVVLDVARGAQQKQSAQRHRHRLLQPRVEDGCLPSPHECTCLGRPFGQRPKYSPESAQLKAAATGVSAIQDEEALGQVVAWHKRRRREPRKAATPRAHPLERRAQTDRPPYSAARPTFQGGQRGQRHPRQTGKPAASY